MKMATVCSGIGAPEMASAGLDFEHVFLSEIEPFPSAVLAHRWPDVPNLGDMTRIDGAAWNGRVDLLVGGTPCQAFSVAGLRESLDDERGNLTLKFVELCNDVRPGFILWENVPGVLSTKDNAFGCFLAGLVGERSPLVPAGRRWTNAGYVSGPERTVAWRILDAQYFGLAQRRRRVFVVACPRNGADPCEVLFEREGVQRHSAPRRKAGQGVAGTLESRTGAGGFPGTDFSCDGGVQPYGACGLNGMSEYNASKPTLRAKCGDAAGGSEALITGPLCANGKAAGSATQQDAESGMILAFHGTQDPISGDVMHPVGRNQGQDHVVAFHHNAMPDQMNFSEHTTASLTCSQQAAACTGMQVRRLTPTECERLQGFPDNHTLIPWRNKPTDTCPDGPRYKAIGNSMAVPVIRWILKRILRENENEKSVIWAPKC